MPPASELPMENKSCSPLETANLKGKSPLEIPIRKITTTAANLNSRTVIYSQALLEFFLIACTLVSYTENQKTSFSKYNWN
jgi:hypothetical protein